MRRVQGDVTFGWLLLVYFFLNFGQGVLPPLLPQVMDGLSLSFASVGLLGTAFGITRFLVDIPAGILAERIGVRGVLHVGIGFLMAGSVFSAVAGSLGAMILARALAGIGSALSILVALLYLMREGPPQSRARRANVYDMAVMSGMGISALLGGAIAAQFGWRWGFLMAATAIGLGWLVATFLVLPRVKSVLPPRDDLHPRESDRGRSALSKTSASIYLAGFSLAVVWAGGIGTLLPLYGGRGLGLSAEVIGQTMAIAYAIEVSLSFPVGWAADVVGRVPIMVLGLVVTLVGVALVPMAASAWAYGAACVLVVMGMTVTLIPPALLAERHSPGFGGKAVGRYRFVTDLGHIVAPGMIGWLIGQASFWTGAAALAGVVGISAGLSLATLKR